MIEKNLLNEVKKMALGVFVLSAVMVGIFALCGFFTIRVVWGALLGASVCVLNYLFLAYCVSKAVDKGEGGAKSYIGGTYTLRMIVIAATIIAAIKLPQYFNYLATAIPFVFPRIVIMIFNLKNKRSLGSGSLTEKKKGEDKIERSEDTV